MKAKNTLSIDILIDHLMAGDDGDVFWKHGRHKRRLDIPAGSLQRSGYRQIRLKIGTEQHCIYAHRAAYALHYGKWPDGEIDHRNGNKEDNRVENLRVATSSENKYNKSMQPNNTSGVKWVKLDKRNRTKPWRACVRKDKKEYAKGGFSTREEAYTWASVTAKQLHGPFFNPG